MEHRTWVGSGSGKLGWKAVNIGGTTVMAGRTREENGKNTECILEADEKLGLGGENGMERGKSKEST